MKDLTIYSNERTSKFKFCLIYEKNEMRKARVNGRGGSIYQLEDWMSGFVRMGMPWEWKSLVSGRVE